MSSPTATLNPDIISEVKPGCGFFTSDAETVGNVAVQDYSISYEIHGTGPIKIFLLMGLLSSMGGWERVVDYFVGQRKGYSILLMDNRGVGKSTTGSFARYTTSGMALDAAAVLDHVGWVGDRSAHLAGISMGGMVALELASLNPKRFRSLSLLVTCAAHTSPPKHRFKAEMAVMFPEAGVKGRIKSMTGVGFSDQKWLESKDNRFPQYESNRERINAVMMFRIEKSPPPNMKTFFGQVMAVRTHNISATRLAAIGEGLIDIIAVAGEEDMMIDPECSNYLAKHLGCKAVHLAGKGHVIIVEAEFETIAEMEAIINSGESRHC